MIRSQEDAAAYLEGLINVERRPEIAYRKFSLAPIRGLLDGLDHPERGLCVIHVAGSKGKGSTALLAEALLLAAGERVGVFTSPHLESWTERFRVDGACVPGAELAAAVEEVRPHVERLRRESPTDAPSFFDATTAVALILFRRAGLRRAVLEVGLGGRLDSTNAVLPAVTCITAIELEHTDKLGGTLAEIATEKAGILKRGVPLVSGRLPDEAERVVAERAKHLCVERARLGHEICLAVEDAGLAGSHVSIRDGNLALEAELGLLGSHQAGNAALALACVRRLPGAPDDASLARAARASFPSARLPGRVELLGKRPWLVVDAAHTVASARALVRALAAIPRRRTHLVLSVSADKDLDGMLRELLPGASQVTLTRAEPVRSLSPETVRSAVQAAAPGLPIGVVPNPHLALRAARQELAADDLLVATGSIYLAGIARRILAETHGERPVRGSRRGPVDPAGGSEPALG
jgi:dihydrofolate synthase/folylpolyglutamate synthase